MFENVDKATSEIANSAMNQVKGIKSVFQQASKILNQAINIHIQHHIVKGSSKEMKY